MNPLHQLQSHGQSVWLDFITRRFVADGSLAKLIRDDGISGVTSNPTIFQKAIAGSSEYDPAIARGRQQGKNAAAIFESLAVEDVQQACDVFRPVYEKTNGRDGFVSLEVNPHLARDTQGTLNEARHLFSKVNRPNVMIKIPGTREGLPAVEQAIGEGINVNVTLIFSLQRYEEVLAAWLSGLERLAQTQSSLGSVASVASFFVSRVDTLVDGQLGKKPGKEALLGKAAIANVCLAYELFEKMKTSDRYRTLEAKGANGQRPLWASTSTKNPSYRDVVYVENLIGYQTINTLPLPTLEAFRDHGIPKATLPGNPQEARQTLDRLASAGIVMDEVTRQLEEEGLRLFVDSYDSLMATLEQKKEITEVQTLS